MKTTLRPSKIKGILSNNIKSMAATLDDYVRRPGHDFSRNRKLTFETMLQMLIGMGGNSLCKELYEWFSFSKDTASVSAFVQQREKILPSAIETLIHRFVASCDESVLFNGYRLFAVDGTDLRLPTNPNDSESYMKNESNTKGYNLVHIDAMYDLMRHVYLDASCPTEKRDERT
ncbi:transposase [Paenibacillus alvei]|uniref:Transposase n=1 Tax=Paenibacillus alvei TaxID=44250 RepID=A0A383RAU3_PAEAL